MTIPSNPILNEEWTNDETGVTYKWDGDRWIVISSGSSAGDLEGYVTDTEFEADQKRQDDLVEVGFDTQSHLLMDVIEIKDEQVVQNDQINALETQIQLLSGVKAVGKWTYRRRVESNAPRPPATATFYGTHKDGAGTVLLNWSDTYLLMINKTDLEGNTYTFSDFEEGDKVEIIATDGSSAVYGTITNNPSNDVYGNMIIDVERFRGGPVEEKEYLISAYRPGSSSPEVDLDILDERYVNRTGSDMIGNAYLNFSGGGLKFVNDDDTTKSYFYNASSTISQWTAYNGSQLKITARDGEPGGGRTFIDIKNVNSSGTGGEDDGYRMKLYHVADPDGDLHGANKRYVDDNFLSLTGGNMTGGVVMDIEDGTGFILKKDGTSNLKLWADGSAETTKTTFSDNHFVTKEYVDEAIAAITNPQGRLKAPGYPFKFAEGDSNVPTGCFQLVGSSGNYKLRISATNADGLEWLQNADNDISYSEGHRYTIYLTFDDAFWHKTYGTYNRTDYHSRTGDVLVYLSSYYGALNYTTSGLYYITLAGMF